MAEQYSGDPERPDGVSSLPDVEVISEGGILEANLVAGEVWHG